MPLDEMQLKHEQSILLGSNFALGEPSHLDGLKCFKEVLDRDSGWRKI